MNDKLNELISVIGKEFTNYILNEVSSWDRAYLRCEFGDGMTTTTCILVSNQETPSFLGMERFDFDDIFCEIYTAIKQSNKKDLKVCLARITSNYEFKMYFEFEDSNKWPIPNLYQLNLALLPNG